jgi:hypothetical protein
MMTSRRRSFALRASWLKTLIFQSSCCSCRRRRCGIRVEYIQRREREKERQRVAAGKVETLRDGMGKQLHLKKWNLAASLGGDGRTSAAP